VSLNVAADAARSFLVGRYLLAPARSLGGEHEGVPEAFRRLASIRFDPLELR
jgi:hypothetical protein